MRPRGGYSHAGGEEHADDGRGAHQGPHTGARTAAWPPRGGEPDMGEMENPSYPAHGGAEDWSPQPPSRATRGSGRLFAVVSMLVAGTLFAGVVWYSYGRNSRNITTGGDVPLIQADHSRHKHRPEQPGGLEVPHQDRLVFDRLNPSTAGTPAKIEKLLPPAETPLPRPEPPRAAPPPPVTAAAPPSPAVVPPAGTTTAGTMTGAAPPPVPATTPGSGNRPPVPPPATAASRNVAGKPASPTPAIPSPTTAAAPPGKSNGGGPPPSSIAALIAQSSGPPPASPPSPTLAPTIASKMHLPATATGGGGGGFRVQLASVRSEAEAQAEWRRLTARFPQQLSNLTLATPRADLGEKGIYYRVQGGSVDEARARTICSELKSQNVGCQIAR